MKSEEFICHCEERSDEANPPTKGSICLICTASGAILTDGTSVCRRHSRESGNPGRPNIAPAAPCSSQGQALGPRFRGGDGKEKEWELSVCFVPLA